MCKRKGYQLGILVCVVIMCILLGACAGSEENSLVELDMDIQEQTFHD